MIGFDPPPANKSGIAPEYSWNMVRIRFVVKRLNANVSVTINQ